jgi:hypothetical protein
VAKQGKARKPRAWVSGRAKFAGSDLRITEGRIDPKFKNDGGSIGGVGLIAWKSARPRSSPPNSFEGVSA